MEAMQWNGMDGWMDEGIDRPNDRAHARLGGGSCALAGAAGRSPIAAQLVQASRRCSGPAAAAGCGGRGKSRGGARLTPSAPLARATSGVRRSRRSNRARCCAVEIGGPSAPRGSSPWIQPSGRRLAWADASAGR
eukprot:scaffold1254_cov376-Prasinococcus_capsulatus_cf.AAC.7